MPKRQALPVQSLQNDCSFALCSFLFPFRNKKPRFFGTKNKGVLKNNVENWFNKLEFYSKTVYTI